MWTYWDMMYQNKISFSWIYSSWVPFYDLHFMMSCQGKIWHHSSSQYIEVCNSIQFYRLSLLKWLGLPTSIRSQKEQTLTCERQDLHNRLDSMKHLWEIVLKWPFEFVTICMRTTVSHFTGFCTAGKWLGMYNIPFLLVSFCIRWKLSQRGADRFFITVMYGLFWLLWITTERVHFSW